MLLVQRVGYVKRNQIRLHLFERIGVILQSLIETAAVLRLVDAEVMTNFMPECAIEVAVGSQFFRLLFPDRGGECPIRRFEDVRLAHDVRAQQDGAAITSRLQKIQTPPHRVPAYALYSVQANPRRPRPAAYAAPPPPTARARRCARSSPPAPAGSTRMSAA